jgi:hypothetical protein
MNYDFMLASANNSKNSNKSCHIMQLDRIIIEIQETAFVPVSCAASSLIHK